MSKLPKTELKNESQTVVASYGIGAA